MIIIDLNSLGFAATAGRPMHSGSIPTQGIYGVLTRLIEIRRAYAGKMVVVHDMRSWRYDYLPTYKGNRKVQMVVDATGTEVEVAPTKSLQALLDMKDEWSKQKPYVCKMLRALGITQLAAHNMEADDLAARLVKATPGEHVVVSGDKDWLQLVSDDVRWFCPIDYKLAPGSKPKPRLVTLENFHEVTGCRDPWEFVQVKALTGDAGDNIPGVGGIGPVNARYIMDNHASVYTLFNEAITDAAKTWPKAVQNFACDEVKQNYFHFNMLMVWLNHPKAPAAVKPYVVKGDQMPDAFCDLCGELAMTSFLNKQDQILNLFNPHAMENA